MRYFVIINALLSLCLSSCITYAESYITGNPDISPEVKQAILEHRIIKGMNPAEVIASWGIPDRRIWEPAENSNIREYKKFIYILNPSSSMRIGVGVGNYDRRGGFSTGFSNKYHSNVSYSIIYFSNNKVINVEIDEGN